MQAGFDKTSPLDHGHFDTSQYPLIKVGMFLLLLNPQGHTGSERQAPQAMTRARTHEWWAGYLHKVAKSLFG